MTTDLRDLISEAVARRHPLPAQLDATVIYLLETSASATDFEVRCQRLHEWPELADHFTRIGLETDLVLSWIEHGYPYDPVADTWQAPADAVDRFLDELYERHSEREG